MLEHALLCLKCRRKGHILDDCEMQEWHSGQKWMFSDTRLAMHFDDAWSTEEHTLCQRCEDLDLIDLLKTYPPWISQSELAKAINDRHVLVKNMGKTGTIQFWEDCSLCRCLFAMTLDPESGNQEVLLLPDWTMCRLAGELGTIMDMEEKRQYAPCLVTILVPTSEDESLKVPVLAHASDALCLLQDEQRTLHGQKITHDMSVVHRWLETCTRLHDLECVPTITEDLKYIRLVDVETRQVIGYPGDCEYVALSYVWGGTTQPSYQLGSQLSELPQTLEDAISYTKALHQKYLWVDSLCIDQSNKKDKEEQIHRMCSIYRGAYVTIIALAGSSANSGLIRPTYSQSTCVIKGQRLVGLMPTLSRQIMSCPWGTRAWTFQEGLLSPRCLFISDHQMYFDCTAMRCCESLDETDSWGHNLCSSSNPTEADFVTWMKDKAGWGVSRYPLRSDSDRLGQWGIKVNLYCYRDMTLEEDAIRACSGILQWLKILYPKGFFWGLPMEDMNWGLAWRSQKPPTRREKFPSWSWAAWKGPVWFGQPPDVTQTRRFPVGLQIHRSKNGIIDQIFVSEYQKLIENDPIDQPLSPMEICLDRYPLAEKEGYLFIVGICFEFAPDFSKPQESTQPSIQPAYFDFSIRRIECVIAIQGLDQEISNCTDVKRFLLLARDTPTTGFMSHYLLLLRDRDGVSERGTVLELRVPQNQLIILEELKPRSECIVLT